MIGVLAEEADWPAVKEFFELFKTPWAFYRRAIPCDVLICANGRFVEDSAALIVIYGTEERSFDEQHRFEASAKQSTSVLRHGDERIPIYGRCQTFTGETPHDLIEERTGKAAAKEFASQTRQKVVRIGYDLFYEVRHLLQCGQPPVYGRIATLDLHIELLRRLITSCAIPLVEIPALPSGYNLVVCLTHDLDHVSLRDHKFDHTMFGFLYRALIGSMVDLLRGRKSLRDLTVNWMAALALPFVHLGLARDVWTQFDRYLDIERNFASTFFVIPQKGAPGNSDCGSAPAKRAVQYDISKIEPQLRRLLAAGCELGLHGINAWRNSENGRQELERIREVTNADVTGVRMHWLYFNEESPAALEAAGFSYDSTFGYNETVGYRAGTTQPFKPLSLTRLMELPLHIMDTALFYPAYMDLSPKQAEVVVRQLIDDAMRFGGALTINWHDRSIAPERLWDGFYIKLLNELESHSAWFPTSADAVAWFRKRRSACVESEVVQNNTLRIKVRLDENDRKLPRLRLRVHHPSIKSASRFTDLVVERSEEFEVPI